MAKISALSSSGGTREARVASHSHIRGLGLDEDGIAREDKGGFVGQRQAREVSILRFFFRRPEVLSDLCGF